MASGRRQYPFHLIEPKWQRAWEEQQTFRAWNPGEKIPPNHPFARRHRLPEKPATAAELPRKFYLLDMFPYPSGAGLHVGHPEGYTATDILARYRRACGFNVLHPMGWDAFGLPAEQYAVKTGQHPRQATAANVANFKRQIKSLGFSYDWTREVNTTDPGYFRWTQWIFLQIYNAWFNPETKRAEPISTLKYPADCVSEEQKRAYRDSQRLAYVSEARVWWCEELGTVLANEEVIDGKSEVGGFPVVRKPMRQWMLRITAYAEKLLQDLNTIDWSDSLKEMQRNWIGRSEGAEVEFEVADFKSADGKPIRIPVFTTRPDTLFGATYLVLAPEHSLVSPRPLGIIPYVWPTTDMLPPENTGTYRGPVPADVVQLYRMAAASKSDLERTELAKEKTGVFTGAYAVNPVNKKEIPIWIADYVLASYGTGAIMAVPGHDTRDLEFAQKFHLPVIQVVAPPAGQDWHGFVGDGVAVNSESGDISLNGLPTPEAKQKITAWLESKGLGKKTINYKLRDWLFSRQRYWGEPFPIVWKRDTQGHLYHEALPESALPVLPPELTDYKPTATGEPPLARAQDWVNLPGGSQRETNTMPQWAGSCWYYLRYLDSQRSQSFCGPLVEHYWMGGPTEGLLLRPEQWANRVRELIAYARSQPASGKRFITFGTVGPAEAQRLREATGLEVEGFRRFLDDQAIRHILSGHGDARTETPRGSIAVTEADFLLIPEVISQPDHVAYGGRTSQGKDAILYEKQVDGFLYCVEEVRDSNRLLAVKTMYKRKTTGARALSGLDQTSETHRRSGANTPDSATAVKPTPGVDLYVGGTEHAVLHLLYARFWHKVLYDLGHVSTPEPFFKLVNQGLILGEDGQKMSKSRGNVINPDDILAEYGADAFRLYEMFMGPLEMVKPWSTKGVEGVYRFLGRVWRLFVDEPSETAFEQNCTAEPGRAGEFLEKVQLSGAIQEAEPTPAQLKTLHACIKKVTEDLDGLRFNTALSALMVFVNEAMTWPTKPAGVMRDFLILLQPFAPHLAEELWAKTEATLNTSRSALSYAPWPQFDPALLVEDTLEIPVQVNGKLRDVIRLPATATDDQIKTAALQSDKAQPFLAGKQIKKIVLVPKKLVNIVVGA